MDKRKRTPKEVVDAIIADSQSLNVAAISEKHAIKKGTIRAILYKNNIKPLKPDPNRFLLSKELLESVLINGWLPINELAQACGCSYGKVKKSLVAHGLLRGKKPTTRSRICESTRSFKVLGYIMANPEMNLEAIAKQFNCTREFVSQVEAMARKEGVIK